MAGCCHLVNSLSRFQSHMSHCRVQSPDEINVMIVQHCRVLEFHPPYWKSFFAIFYFFLFLMQFRLWRAAAFVSSSIDLLWSLHKAGAVAAGEHVRYKLISGRMLRHAVVVNALRHRRDVNPPAAEYVNITATTFRTNYSTVGVADVTSSSLDVTSSLRLWSNATTLSLRTSTQNTSSLNVDTVDFDHFVTIRYTFCDRSRITAKSNKCTKVWFIH